MSTNRNADRVAGSSVGAAHGGSRSAARPVEVWEGRQCAIRVGMALVGLLFCAGAGQAQEPRTVELTLESSVVMAMEQSYRIRQVRMGIERTRSLLRAERAELRTRIDLEVSAPEFEALSEHQWNSDLGRNELVQENSRRWQANLSIRQPVILFGYPTNGYLSFNTSLYRYTQLQSDEPFTSYYNRYYLEYEQPLFQPNELKFELQEAVYDLEEAEMEFQENVVGLIDDVADDYYGLFALAYEREIYSEHVANLERAAAEAQRLARVDSSRATDADQMQVELANARERLQQARSAFRLDASRMKQRLRLDPADSLELDPVLDVQPVQIDLERAIRLGTTIPPRLRELAIERWSDEVELEEVRAEDSFQVDLEFTYGREMEDPYFRALLEEPRNSYTVSVNANIPIWDWGARDARIEAARIGLQQTDLNIEETRAEIRADITNAVRNLEAYQQRATDMEQNLELATQLSTTGVARYAAGEITTLELLRSLDRRTETAENFLETYLGYRRALLELQQLTYYDFERDVPVLERFRVAATPLE